MITMGNSISKRNQKLLAKAEALKKITEHNRDYLSLTLTIPLGNTALKKVHTNQWLFTNLPAEFDLANWTILAQALSSATNRYEKYVQNRWYIEAVDIDVDVKGKAEMKLTLNAFASTYSGYTQTLKDMKKAYTDAKNNASKNTASSKNKTNAVKKKKKKSKKKGEGKVIDNLVKSIVGKESNALKKAKLIHKYLQYKVGYTFYRDSKYSTPEKCLKNIGHLNCTDTSRLTASMMRSAGVDCYVVHSTCHYYTVIKYKGKLYCSDATSRKRDFNEYWKASSCNNGSTAKFKGKSSYNSKCGKEPSS